MHTFCTRCGHRNENPGGFCDNCGAPLKQPQTLTAAQDLPLAQAQVTPRPLNPQTKKRLLLATGLTVMLLVGGGGGLAWWLQAPQATPDNLLASARVGWPENDLKQLRQQLCIGNTDYRSNPFDVNSYDQRTRNWFDTLVAAGLYQEPESLRAGFMGETLRYVPTPELEKYRDGSRLCVATGVELTAVDVIQTSGDENSRAVAQVTVSAKGLAPWISNPVVREPLVNELRQWAWKDGALQRTIEMTFLVQDRQWVTGPDIQKEARSPQAKTLPKKAAQATSSSDSDSWWTKLMSIFSLNSNPLHGTWQQKGLNIMGLELPAGMTPNITFTSTSMEVSGVIVPVTYEVDGERIIVKYDDNTVKQIFMMHGKDEMVMGGTGIRYQRSQ